MLCKLTMAEDGRPIYVNPEDVGSVDSCAGVKGVSFGATSCLFMRGVMLSHYVRERADAIAELLEAARATSKMEALTLGPDDVVILRTEASLTKEQREGLVRQTRDALAPAGPGRAYTVYVMPYGVDLQILHREQAEAEGVA